MVGADLLHDERGRHPDEHRALDRGGEARSSLTRRRPTRAHPRFAPAAPAGSGRHRGIHGLREGPRGGLPRGGEEVRRDPRPGPAPGHRARRARRRGMKGILDALVAHGLLLVVASVLINQLGIPIPSDPILVGAGALAGSGRLRLAMIVLLGAVASLAAALVWYEAGRRGGGAGPAVALPTTPR